MRSPNGSRISSKAGCASSRANEYGFTPVADLARFSRAERVGVRQMLLDAVIHLLRNCDRLQSCPPIDGRPRPMADAGQEGVNLVGEAILSRRFRDFAHDRVHPGLADFSGHSEGENATGYEIAYDIAGGLEDAQTALDLVADAAGRDIGHAARREHKSRVREVYFIAEETGPDRAHVDDFRASEPEKKVDVWDHKIEDDVGIRM